MTVVNLAIVKTILNTLFLIVQATHSSHFTMYSATMDGSYSPARVAVHSPTIMNYPTSSNNCRMMYTHGRKYMQSDSYNLIPYKRVMSL